MLEIIKKALRISASAFDSEIELLIDACKSDLGLAGVTSDETKPIIQMAIMFYCKANFGYEENPERWQKAYQSVKEALSISLEYRQV